MFAKIVFLLIIAVNFVNSGIYSNMIDTPLSLTTGGFENSFTSSTLDFFRGINSRRRCPICDPSVYSYCTDKLFHDSCCCHNPNNPYDQLPYQCSFADCSFLHSNTCEEHKLITACCCINTNMAFYKK